MRNLLVAGNWKMNGSSASNAELLDGIVAWRDRPASVDMLVCPPFPYLQAVGERLAGTGIHLGAQSLSEHGAGAFTGETSADMLADVGCSYVLVGHSERRSLYGESSATVAAKFAAALAAGLTPVLCVGETLEDREAEKTSAVIDEQLDAVLAISGIEGIGRAVVAYEPVWAIGTGKTASPDQAQDVHRHIRAVLGRHDPGVAERTQILYGGSVKGENAAGLFGKPDIDGGLIGGASLKAPDFLAIAEAAAGL